MNCKEVISYNNKIQFEVDELEHEYEQSSQNTSRKGEKQDILDVDGHKEESLLNKKIAGESMTPTVKAKSVIMNCKEVISYNNKIQFEVDELEHEYEQSSQNTSRKGEKQDILDVDGHKEESLLNKKIAGESMTPSTVKGKSEICQITPKKRKLDQMLDHDEQLNEKRSSPVQNKSVTVKSEEITSDESEFDSEIEFFNSVSDSEVDEEKSGEGDDEYEDDDDEDEDDDDEDGDDKDDDDDEDENYKDFEDDEDIEVWQGPDSKPSDPFTLGAFVVLKKDLRRNEYPQLWKIEGTWLLKKYIPFNVNGKILYRNTEVYTTWLNNNQSAYYDAPISFLMHTKEKQIIEFVKDKIIRGSNIFNAKEMNSEIIDLVGEDDEIYEISDDDDNHQFSNNVKKESDSNITLKIDDKIICISDDDDDDDNIDNNLNNSMAEINKDFKMYKDEKKEVENIDINDVDNNLKDSETEKIVEKSEIEGIEIKDDTIMTVL